MPGYGSSVRLSDEDRASFLPVTLWPRPIVGRGLPLWPGAIDGGGVTSVNRLEMFPVVAPYPVTINQLGIHIATAEASATPRLGLYGVTEDGLPGELLVDAGTVDASTTGNKTAAVSPAVELSSGLAYFAVAWQGAASALRFTRYAPGTSLPVVSSSLDEHLTSNGARGFRLAGVSAALPADVSAAGRTALSVPVMWMRVAAVL